MDIDLARKHWLVQQGRGDAQETHAHRLPRQAA
jgi:hypothetical protein